MNGRHADFVKIMIVSNGIVIQVVETFLTMNDVGDLVELPERRRGRKPKKTVILEVFIAEVNAISDSLSNISPLACHKTSLTKEENKSDAPAFDQAEAPVSASYTLTHRSRGWK